MVHGPEVDRIMRDIGELAEIGRDSHFATTRLAYTKADKEARDWLVLRMQEAGLGVEVDAIGNVFGWLPGNSKSPPLLLGSHTDTVPGGGAYDGVLGVVSALETVRGMVAQGWRPHVSVGVVSFACEEGSRFGMSSIGSRALTGGLTKGDLSRLKDHNGVSLAEALEIEDSSPEKVELLKRDPGWFRAYLEAHIDQGPELEETGQPIGIVRVIAGISRYKLTFSGKQAHAGAARMGRRTDAMAAAAEAILFAEEEANSRLDEVVATVGMIQAVPGIINVLPGYVRLGLDVRTVTAEARDSFLESLRGRITERAQARNVITKWDLLSESQPVAIPRPLRETLLQAFDEVALSRFEVTSWAGHDAAFMAEHGPAGMLLVRNQGKVSHHPDELVRADDIALLVRVLKAVLTRLTKP